MLILASQSPRRSQLLRNAGISFTAQPADIDETQFAEENAADYVRRLARGKALTILSNAAADAVVLGADTTVVVDGAALGKPADARDARRMLQLLGGRRHEVMTGVCVAWKNPRGEAEVLVECEVTEVEFCQMSDEEIAGYIASGEPMDKAGAYGIQGLASRWIPRVNGCYFNIVGLPVARVSQMLKEARQRGAHL
ncbi:MAG: Maf family protein [Acidobacteriota bacterium]|nr:Maf family protein [Acidobacteriota bacterium]